MPCCKKAKKKKNAVEADIVGAGNWESQKGNLTVLSVSSKFIIIYLQYSRDGNLALQ